MQRNPALALIPPPYLYLYMCIYSPISDWHNILIRKYLSRSQATIESFTATLFKISMPHDDDDDDIDIRIAITQEQKYWGGNTLQELMTICGFLKIKSNCWGRGSIFFQVVVIVIIIIYIIIYLNNFIVDSQSTVCHRLRHWSRFVCPSVCSSVHPSQPIPFHRIRVFQHYAGLFCCPIKAMRLKRICPHKSTQLNLVQSVNGFLKTSSGKHLHWISRFWSGI